MTKWRPISECPFGEMVLAASLQPSTSILGPLIIWWTEEEATDWPDGWPAPTHYAPIPGVGEILKIRVAADGEKSADP